VLVDIGSWYLLFAFTAGYAALLLPVPLALPATPGSYSDQGWPDLVGGLLFVPSVAAILLGLSNGASWGWTSYSVLGLILGGGALMTFWAWYEGRQHEPLTDVRLLLKPQIALANISLSLSAMGVFLVSFLMLLILQQPPATDIGLGLSASMAGVLKIPSNVGAAIAAPLSGLLFALRWRTDGYLRGEHRHGIGVDPDGRA
jgi:hypothetical protein